MGTRRFSEAMESPRGERRRFSGAAKEIIPSHKGLEDTRMRGLCCLKGRGTATRHITPWQANAPAPIVSPCEELGTTQELWRLTSHLQTPSTGGPEWSYVCDEQEFGRDRSFFARRVEGPGTDKQVAQPIEDGSPLWC